MNCAISRPEMTTCEARFSHRFFARSLSLTASTHLLLLATLALLPRGDKATTLHLLARRLSQRSQLVIWQALEKSSNVCLTLLPGHLVDAIGHVVSPSRVGFPREVVRHKIPARTNAFKGPDGKGELIRHGTWSAIVMFIWRSARPRLLLVLDGSKLQSGLLGRLPVERGVTPGGGASRSREEHLAI
jgi:hypothetical protein